MHRGFIEGRLFHNGQQYFAFSPLTPLIFQLQTEFIRSLRQVVIEGGISVIIRIDPIMIHPLQLIRYATSRIQRIQKRRKENLNIPIIRTKENLMYRILSRGFRIANIPSVAYATVYPIAMVFLILFIQIIATMF